MTLKSRVICGALGLGLVLALDWPARADTDQPLAPSPAPRACIVALARAHDLLRQACDGDYSPGCADRDAPPPPDGPGLFAPLDPFHAGVILSSGVGWLTDEAVHRYSLGRAGPTFHIGVTLELFDLITGAFSGGAIFPGDPASTRRWSTRRARPPSPSPPPA